MMTLTNDGLKHSITMVNQHGIKAMEWSPIPTPHGMSRGGLSVSPMTVGAIYCCNLALTKRTKPHS